MTLRTRTETEGLRALAEATRAFASVTGDYPLLLATIARRTADKTGCHCSLGLVSADGRWLDEAAAHDADAEARVTLTAALFGPRLATDGESSSAQVLRAGKSLRLTGAALEQQLSSADPPMQARVQALRVRGLAAAPIRSHGQVVGVLSITRHGADAPPLEVADVEFVEAVAEHAGLAIHNAQLLRSLQGELAERREAEQRLASERERSAATDLRDQADARERQQALRDSEEKYRGLVEQSIAGVFIIQDGRFVYGSLRLAELFGYASPEELVARGPGILEMTAPEHRARLATRVAQRLAGESSKEWLSFTGLRRDGQRLALQAHSRLVVHEGRPGLIGLMLDVTETERAREESRKSEVRYRQLFDNSPLAKWIYHQQTLRFLEVNQAALDLYGYTREEFLRLEIKDLRPPEEYPTMAADLRRGATYDGLFGVRRHWRKDRTILEVEVTGQNFQYGDALARLVTAQDVTERRRTERELRESEEKFRQLAENIHEVFWITDVRKSRVLYISPGYQVIWGRAPESLQRDASSWMESIHPEDRERVVEAARTKQRDGGYDEVYRILRPDGEQRWIRDRAYPVRRGDGAEVDRLVGIAEDVTELRQTEAQLRQSQKMEAFGQLAGGIAHDFNNLLTVILSASQELNAALQPGDPLAESLEALNDAAGRAAALTRQLLVFSRRQAVTPRVLDLNELSAGLAKLLRRLLGEDLALTLDLAPGLPALRADAGHLEQLLVNLAVNARDAMPQGGTLTLATAEVLLDEAAGSALPGGRAGRFVRLSVTDTGCGMTPEVRARIFEPFFTTKPVGRGTGLGLATVFGIVQKSDGFIEVRSQPGEGTAFCVYLPAVEVRPSAEGPGPERPGSAGSERVLLVEDDAAVRRIAGRVLAGCGYRVTEASDGAKALLLGLEEGRAFDLLVTDVVMPGLGGPALVEKLRAAHPELKILFMSGHAGDAMARHGLATSSVPFLHKPFTASALLARVRAVLDGRE